MNSATLVVAAGDSNVCMGPIYPTRVKAFGSMQDCIRVREEIPAEPKPVAQAVHVEESPELDDVEDVTDDNLWEPDHEA